MHQVRSQKSEVKIVRDQGERKPNQQSTINNSYFKSAMPQIKLLASYLAARNNNQPPATNPNTLGSQAANNGGTIPT